MTIAAHEGFVRTSDGLNLHYLEWGRVESPGMVLVHGTASHAHLWDRFGPAFADQFHVVAIDQRGHGDSDAPADYRTGYPTEAWTADLKAVIDGLQLAPAVLIGISGGGASVLHYAAEYPADVARLVVIEMSPIPAREGVARVVSSIPRQEEFESLEAGIEFLTRSGGRSDPELGRNHAIHALRPLGGGRVALKGDPSLRRSDWRRPLRVADENWRAVRSINCPTLLVRGGESRFLTPEAAEEMQSAMADCTVVTIEGAGHAIPLHRPAELEAAIGTWLASRPTPA